MRRLARALAASAALSLGALTAGCSGPASADGPLVVVTTNILGDVVERLVGGQAEVMTLMAPDATRTRSRSRPGRRRACSTPT
ncbi:hypothetical protein [Rathayibacter sp. VKM Ac-2630]|uniref:hypothetical protein n=1 Tax=Rathayibacter sp. VKM Ac-2630 TaxID=1938617 RepID=UPI0026ADE989